ncbi:MAG: excinuclease ABC subunit B, partial [Planctomycetaceae bacterium]|nr:excinuclease ABC subunit B [Planctomycetaceae bacterium]
SYEEFAFRIELWGDEIEQLSYINPLTGEVIEVQDRLFIYPAKHFVTTESRIATAVDEIKKELAGQLEKFRECGKLLEAQRLSARTRFDVEMLQAVGHCPGIENYSRPLSGRPPGATPETLYNFCPDDFLLFVDESHVTVPQVRAMYAGDRSRKETLVEHGFRLPSALDNRPMKFEEWENRIHKSIMVSATPGDYELEKSGGEIVEQIIRPTGLLDPEIDVVPARGQVAHLLEQIKERRDRGDRVLVTALTKRLAEDLSAYFCENGVKSNWLHSELNAFERVEILQELRAGRYDVLVGVNLLREGLDLPEVSLVAIMDADKEGFLRSETSLIQTIGRSARNVNARVILYADRVTAAMKAAIDETQRRRKIQQQYNDDHGITPKTVSKNIRAGIESDRKAHEEAQAAAAGNDKTVLVTEDYINSMQTEMLKAAEDLDFEKAASLRDRITQLQDQIGEPLAQVNETKSKYSRKGRKGGRGGGRQGRGKVPRPKKLK